jgi:23S rRNA (cytidine1920-2'-O)/16S rRNA (cytidine1409-2'-O)-methyltransferase
MTRTRADIALVEHGLADGPAKAQALILAGLVFSGERKILKAGELIAADALLEVRGKDHPWVSRGGIKLDHGLSHFGWEINGATVLDIGASTGGFTDVALARGAARVFAVDVGSGQLAWKLRTDARVAVLEKTNARHLTVALVPEPIDLLVCDVSFISIRLALPAAMALVRPGGRLVALIKPQFEAAREQIGKGGVVRDEDVRLSVCDALENWLDNQPGWTVAGITQSPITGPEGNVEYLIGAVRNI